MKNILALTIEGFLEWSKPGGDWSVFSVLSRVLGEACPPDVHVIAEKFQSFGFWQTNRIGRWIRRPNFPANYLLMVLKSKGGPKGLEVLLRNPWIYECFAKIAIVFVDPHGNALGDEMLGPYGKNRSINFWKIGDFAHRWDPANLRMWAICQQHASPSGARVIGAAEQVDLTGDQTVDHFSIVHRPETRRLIESALKWLAE